LNLEGFEIGFYRVEGSVTALVMAVLEDGDALETGGVTGDAGGVVILGKSIKS
jgi:hypothetical protein